MAGENNMTVQRKYRVVQWATGNVGKVSIRQFLENPAFDLVGVLVTNPDKVGKDAGELASLPPTGIIATDDVEAIIALDADCVHFAAAAEDIEMVCRLLRTGKNVVSPLGPFFPSSQYPHSIETSEAIAAACAEGGPLSTALGSILALRGIFYLWFLRARLVGSTTSMSRKLSISPSILRATSLSWALGAFLPTCLPILRARPRRR